jgi:hypothetical protein
VRIVFVVVVAVVLLAALISIVILVAFGTLAVAGCIDQAREAKAQAAFDDDHW